MSDFILGGSKVTADGDGSHEIKRCLLLGRKVMTNLDNIFKSRDIVRNSGLEEAQAGFKIARRTINNLRYTDDTTLMAESEEEIKKPLDESESGE